MLNRLGDDKGLSGDIKFVGGSKDGEIQNIPYWFPTLAFPIRPKRVVYTSLDDVPQPDNVRIEIYKLQALRDPTTRSVQFRYLLDTP